MISHSDEGIYTKDEAFKFLKKLLGLSSKCQINKEFFSLFFSRVDDKSDIFYKIRNTEEFIRKIFEEKGLVILNKLYYEKKRENKTAEADLIAREVINIVQKSLS